MVKKQSLTDAVVDFKKLGFSKKKSYFELEDKELNMLRSLLDITKYSKSKNAPGSKLRAFYEALQKKSKK